MREPGTRSASWVRAGAGLVATLALVGLPIELTIELVEHPVMTPGLTATLLTIGSCLLLVWSGLGLRRLEAGRAPGPPPSSGA